MRHISYKCLSFSRAYLAREYNRLSSLLAAQDASQKSSRPLNKNSILKTLINYIVYTINLVVTGFQVHTALCFSMSIIVRFWVLLQRSGSRTQMLPVKPRAYIPRTFFSELIACSFNLCPYTELTWRNKTTTYQINQQALVNHVPEKSTSSIFFYGPNRRRQSSKTSVDGRIEDGVTAEFKG